MRRYRSLLLLAVLTGISVGQNASMMVNRDIRRVGTKLACLCGSCKNSVGDCQMMGCSYAGRARTQIAQMQAGGASDEGIIAKFVEQTGLQALSAPPAQGFQLTAWLMPFAMLLVGLYAIYVYVKRFRQPAPVPAGVHSKHLDQAEKELAGLD